MFESKVGASITATHNEVASESKPLGYCNAQRELRVIIAGSALGEQDKEYLESLITRLEADATVISYMLEVLVRIAIQHGVSMTQLLDEVKRRLEHGGPSRS